MVYLNYSYKILRIWETATQISLKLSSKNIGDRLIWSMDSLFGKTKKTLVTE